MRDFRPYSWLSAVATFEGKDRSKEEGRRMTAPAPKEMTRLVKDGTVFCAVQMGRVDIDQCRTCNFLTRYEPDDSGEMTELVCSPSYAALLGGMSI